MSDIEPYHYEPTDEERQTLYGTIAFLVIASFIWFRSWETLFVGPDANADGRFTISDISMAMGHTLSVAWVEAYAAAGPLVAFFELPIPYEATALTATTGFGVTVLLSSIGGYMVSGLIMWLRRFPAHWRNA